MTTANVKLTKTPAIDTQIHPLFLFLKLSGFTGTGLAQPNLINIIITKPIGSKWAKGLRVYRPANFGVSSPHLTAANAWANSCKGKIIKIAHFQRIKIAHFAFSAIYTIAIVQNALFSFPFFCFHSAFIISLIFENFNKKWYEQTFAFIFPICYYRRNFTKVKKKCRKSVQS